MPLVLRNEDAFSYVHMLGDLDTYKKLDAGFAAEARIRFAGNNPEQGGIFMQRRSLNDPNPLAFDWILGYEGFGHLYFLRQFAGSLRVWRVLADAMVWDEPGWRVGDPNIYHQVNLLDGAWHQVGVSVDINEVRLYIDGREMKAELVSDAPAALMPQPDYSLIVGYTAPEKPLPEQTFDGEIEEVRLWRQAPSREKILQWTNRRLQGNEEGLLGYWPMNDTDARDLRGVNHGTIVNATIRPSNYLPDMNSPVVFHETVLVEDYRQGQENKLEVIANYRTIVSFNKPDGSAWQGEIALSAPEHCRVEVDGDMVELAPNTSVVARVNITGQMEWVTEAKDETTPPPIIVSASSFMHARERLIIYRDDVLHQKMATLDGASMRTDRPGRPALLDPAKYTLESANDFARTVRDVMGRYVKPHVRAATGDHNQNTKPSFVAFHHNEAGSPLGVAYAVRHQLPEQANMDGNAIIVPERMLKYAAPVGMLAASNQDLVRESHFMLIATPQGLQRIELDGHGYAKESNAMLSSARIETRGLSSLWDRFVNGVTKATKVLVKVTEKIVHDAVTKVSQYVRIIKVTIETAIDKAKDFVIDTIEKAAKLVQGLIHLIGELFQKFAKWLSDKTGWSDVLLTKEFIKLQINDVLDGSVAMVGNLKLRAERYFGQLQNQLDEQFDKIRDQLVKASNSPQFISANRRQVLDAKGGWLLRTLCKKGPQVILPEGRASSVLSNQSEVDRLIQRFLNVVEDPKIRHALLDAVEGIRTAMNRPQQANFALLVAGLDSLKALSRLALGLADVLLDIVLTLLQKAISAMRDLLNEEIKIPIVSALYQEISGGQALTVLDLAALTVALPVTVVYKRYHNDQAPFDGNELTQFRQHKLLPLENLFSLQSVASSSENNKRWDQIEVRVPIEVSLLKKAEKVCSFICGIALYINSIVEMMSDVVLLAPNLPSANASIGADAMKYMPVEATGNCLSQWKIYLQFPSLIASLFCFSIRGTDSSVEGDGKSKLSLYGADLVYYGIGILREILDSWSSVCDKLFPAKMAEKVNIKGLSNIGDVVTVFTSLFAAVHCLSAVAVTVNDIYWANDPNRTDKPDCLGKIGFIAVSNVCSTLPGTFKFLGMRPIVQASDGFTYFALMLVDYFGNVFSGATTLELARGKVCPGDEE